MTERKNVFLSWLNGKKMYHGSNMLERADTLSQVLFKKEYDNCITYEKNYVIQQLRGF